MKISNSILCSLIICIIITTTAFAQTQPSKLKGLLQFGVNMPEQIGFVEEYEGKEVNFPSIILGLEAMFNKQMGVRVDLGHNRISNVKDTPEFKLNYTRINAQLTYDFTSIIPIMPRRLGMVGHVGPGYTMIRPLAQLRENKNGYLNAMGGLEIHFGLSKTASVFVDGSYIYGFSKKFDPVTAGYGSYNSNLTVVSLGIAVSISGCYYCNK